MAGYTIATTVALPYVDAVAATRAALQEQGFGILTEIDLRATLKERLGVDVTPQVILGACRPALAHEALQAEPSIAAVLPCNVVVRALDADSTVVEAFDPDTMTGLDDNPALLTVATDARGRLTTALDSLTTAAGSARSAG